jgi:hypothetical protein
MQNPIMMHPDGLFFTAGDKISEESQSYNLRETPQLFALVDKSESKTLLPGEATPLSTLVA